MMAEQDSEMPDFEPDFRLMKAYREAKDLDQAGLDALCPTYSELKAESDRYVEKVLVGRGGLKQVYKCFDRRVQRWVAMARLRDDRGPDFYEVFIHEARLIASLNHPNIIDIYDLGVSEDDRPFFVMDLKGQTTLADVVNDRSRAELVQIFSKISDAIAYAHSQGVLHLDLKPENIQCDAYGDVLVCDWGLGKVWNPADPRMEDIQLSTELLNLESVDTRRRGTPGYMAPEKLSGEGIIDPQADVFALGCLLQFLLVGEPPFQGSREDVLHDMKRSKPTSLRYRYPNLHIPESLNAIVAKATAIPKENRYTSVSSLHDDLLNYLNGFATRAERPGFFRRCSLFIARHRLPVSIIILALLAVASVTTLYEGHFKQQEQIVQAEKDRAEQLDTQFGGLTADFDALESELKRSKKEIAHEIASTASFVKHMAIFERPKQAIKQTRILTNTALGVDSDCQLARLASFKLDCLQLNFAEALKYKDFPNKPPDNDKNYTWDWFFRIAQAFPEYNFNESERPSMTELSEFFLQAPGIGFRKLGFFERVLAYDFACRNNTDGYEQVLEAFLIHAHNDSKGTVKLNYSPSDSDLVLQINANKVHLASPLISVNASKLHYLKFLSFNHLKLEIDGLFHLADLNELPLVTLDISKSSTIELTTSLALPQLKEIRITKGQFLVPVLRQRIQSNEPFAIITVPAKE